MTCKHIEITPEDHRDYVEAKIERDFLLKEKNELIDFLGRHLANSMLEVLMKNVGKGVIDLATDESIGVEMLACSFAKALGDAPNLSTTTIRFAPDENLKLSVTIQREGGKSPAELMKEKDDKIAELQSKLDAAMSQVHKLTSAE